jgi:hypothetical protein
VDLADSASKNVVELVIDALELRLDVSLPAHIELPVNLSSMAGRIGVLGAVHRNEDA